MGAWSGGEEGFTEKVICVKKQVRGIWSLMSLMEEHSRQKAQQAETSGGRIVPGLPETLRSEVNE